MVDQLIYRLNRVPDRNYVKFLELIGVELRPPAAATGRGDVLAVRAAAAAGAGAPTRPRWRRRAPTSTTRSCSPRRATSSIVPCSFTRAGTALVGAEPVDLTAALSGEPGVRRVLAEPHARRRAADRADQRGAVVRGHPPDGVHRRRRRRRPATAAAGLGGLDRQRLDPLRGRPRRHRRAQPGRRRRAARARRPPGLDHRPGTRRLAALPAGRPPARPADVHGAAAGQRDHGVHDRRHRPDGERRGPAPRDARQLRRHPGQRFPLLRRPVLASTGAGHARGADTRGRAGLDRGAPLRRVRARRPALPARPRRRRGAVRAGGAAGRRRRCATTARCRPAARRCC